MSGLTKAHGLPTIASVLEIATLDSPPTYIPIANLGDFKGPGSKYHVQDVTAHGDRVRRKVSTVLDPGTITAPCFFIPGADIEASHTDTTNGLRAIHERGDLRAFRIAYKDELGTARYFNAYVTNMSETASVQGVLTCDTEFTIDGDILTGTESGGLASGVFAPAES